MATQTICTGVNTRLTSIIARHTNFVAESIIKIAIDAGTATVVSKLSENSRRIRTLGTSDPINKTLFAGIMTLLAVVKLSVFCIT